MREFGFSLLRFVFAFMLIGGMYEYAPPSWGAYGVLLAFLGLSVLVTLVHELGHALAVWVQRGTVIEISVFGLTYAPGGGGRFALKALPRDGDLAGYVAYLPPEDDWTRRQYGVVAAAGPFADALLALLAFGAAMWLAAPDTPARAPVAMAVAYDDAPYPPAQIRSNLPSNEERERIVADVAARRQIEKFEALAPMLMVVAFMSAVGNLLPNRGSDGAKLLELWRGRNRFARGSQRR